MDTLEYEFDDLPIMSEGGFEAGCLDGKAVINYYEDGEWSVDFIYLRATKAIYVNGRFDRIGKTTLQVEDHNSGLYLTIWSQLTDGRFKDHIQAKVNEALDLSDIRMPTDMREHNTHSAAYSGIV